MLCFAHDDAPAIAVCRTCGKALCSACAEQTQDGIACAGVCAEHTASALAMLQQSRSALEKARQSLYTTCRLLLMVGSVLVTYGFWGGPRVVAIVGMLLVVLAIAGYVLTLARDPS